MTEHDGATLLFDLDGTLVDSDYRHALAWHEALKNPPQDRHERRVVHERDSAREGLQSILRVLNVCSACTQQRSIDGWLISEPFRVLETR